MWEEVLRMDFCSIIISIQYTTNIIHLTEFTFLRRISSIWVNSQMQTGQNMSKKMNLSHFGICFNFWTDHVYAEKKICTFQALCTTCRQ